MTNEEFEDLIEQGYWEFEHLRTMYSEHVISDRDKFKQAMRSAAVKLLGKYYEESI